MIPSFSHTITIWQTCDGTSLLLLIYIFPKLVCFSYWFVEVFVIVVVVIIVIVTSGCYLKYCVGIFVGIWKLTLDRKNIYTYIVFSSDSALLFSPLFCPSTKLLPFLHIRLTFLHVSLTFLYLVNSKIFEDFCCCCCFEWGFSSVHC